ncbi:ArsR/SmtB family transcription factor [Peptoniphilus sp. HCN-40583]|uniref:ArsR/SmtB family transcription factor n=1 Tax=Peptoniphilus sp. HCN-40583 TaxID=3134662 RepID=UPI0030C15F75
MKDSYGDYVLMLKTISEETRLKIIDMLSCGELCACDILEKLSISQSTLSYHMNLLTKSGLVDGRKDGPWMKYTLNQSRISELKAFLATITTAKTDCICK